MQVLFILSGTPGHFAAAHPVGDLDGNESGAVCGLTVHLVPAIGRAPENGLGNYDPIQSELAQNATSQALHDCFRIGPSSRSKG